MQLFSLHQIKSRRWDFHLDIAAPQIIMPESFSDVNTILVVFDLGRLQFHNLQTTPTSPPPSIVDDNDGEEREVDSFQVANHSMIDHKKYPHV